MQGAVTAARRLSGWATLDLNTLTGMGVKLIGRLVGMNDGKAQFSGSLRNVCALTDLEMVRLLDRIDEWATENGLDDEVAVPHRFAPTEVEASPPLGLELTTGEIQNRDRCHRFLRRITAHHGASRRITAHPMNVITSLVMPIDRLDFCDEAKHDRT